MGIERDGKVGQAWGGKEPHRDKHTGYDDDLIVPLSNAVATSYMCLVRIKMCCKYKTHTGF